MKNVVVMKCRAFSKLKYNFLEYWKKIFFYLNLKLKQPQYTFSIGLMNLHLHALKTFLKYKFNKVKYYNIHIQ